MFVFLLFIFTITSVIIILLINFKSKSGKLNYNNNNTHSKINEKFNISSPFWECPVNKSSDTIYTSQAEEDKYVINYFIKNKLYPYNRVYIEVGAYDGYEISNTYALEHGYGWKGLLIEASPKVFKRLKKTDRPRSIKLNSAICDEEDLIDYIDEDTGHGGIKKYKNNEYGKIKIEIRCFPIRKIITENGLRYIDVFSLDVEGAEESVLNSFDWNVPVRIWIIEVNAIKLGSNDTEKQRCEKVKNILSKHGYKYLGMSSPKSVNEFFYDPYFDEKIKKYVEEDNEVYKYKKC